MTRQFIAAVILLFSVSASHAEGANAETIYDPNTPALSAEENYLPDNPFSDPGLREKLDLPWNGIFENDWLGRGDTN